MGMFGALDSAASGANVSRYWMDAISDNMANLNTVRPAGEEPYRAREVVVQALEDASGVGGGVAVTGIVEKGGDPPMVWNPDHPFADENGMVTMPQIDISEEMTNLLIAQRTYQANLAVIDRVRDAYQQALQIGRRS
jgi:flagellar basal-body rod protein FlgC